jgi:DNA polymerase I-like protein with 3'-5' exonuclease and polymerase domains
MQNQLLRRRFEADVRWALQDPLPSKPRVDARIADARDPYELAALDPLLDGGEPILCAFDVEWYGEPYEDCFRVLSVACAFDALPDRVFVWGEEALDGNRAIIPLTYLRDVMQAQHVRKVAHNAKGDVTALRQGLHIDVVNVYGDTQLWRKLLAVDTDGQLEVCAELVGRGGHKAEADEYVAAETKRLRAVDRANGMYSKHKNYEAYAYAAIPTDVLWRYNARDTQTTRELAQLFETHLRKSFKGALWQTWEEIMRPAVPAFAQVEAWGIGVSRSAAEHLRAYLTQSLHAAQATLDQYGPEVNWNSAPQKQKLLYETLGLPVVKRTDKGAPSTDKYALAKLRDRHPVIPAMQEWARLDKLLGTYVNGLIPYIGYGDRVHPSFRLDGTKTGRISCSSPNLQNLPRADTPEGKMVRDLFIAAPGTVLLEADFSQLELRVAAMLSGDPDMCAVFESGVDYHLHTAKTIAPVFGVDPSTITKEHPLRSRAKIVIFSLIYGKNDVQLADDLGCNASEAAHIRQAVLGAFPVLAAWRKKCLRETQRTGAAWTWWNGRRARRRPLWAIADTDSGPRGNAERSSYNTPVQGSAHDYCISSVVAIVNWILQEQVPAKVVLTVHDSVLLEVRESELPWVATRVRQIMESWPCDVPLVVDLKAGPAWGSLEEYKP